MKEREAGKEGRNKEKEKEKINFFFQSKCENDAFSSAFPEVSVQLYQKMKSDYLLLISQKYFTLGSEKFGFEFMDITCFIIFVQHKNKNQ